MTFFPGEKPYWQLFTRIASSTASIFKNFCMCVSGGMPLTPRHTNLADIAPVEWIDTKKMTFAKTRSPPQGPSRAQRTRVLLYTARSVLMPGPRGPVPDPNRAQTHPMTTAPTPLRNPIPPDRRLIGNFTTGWSECGLIYAKLAPKKQNFQQ